MEEKLLKRIRISIWIVIIGLAVSGLTAFSIEQELAILVKHSGSWPDFLPRWLLKVYHAIAATNKAYPFISYGTDWLAFAHLVLAILFIGPLKYPVRNVWVIDFGLMACALILPLAFIAGAVRGIPIFWRLIDCSFGVFAAIPLYIAHSAVKKLMLLPHHSPINYLYDPVQ